MKKNKIEQLDQRKDKERTTNTTVMKIIRKRRFRSRIIRIEMTKKQNRRTIRNKIEEEIEKNHEKRNGEEGENCERRRNAVSLSGHLINAVAVMYWPSPCFNIWPARECIRRRVPFTSQRIQHLI